MHQDQTPIDPKLKTYDEYHAAEITGFSVKTLQQRRWKGLPPIFLKVGRKVRYRESDLLAFLDTCTQAVRNVKEA